MRFASGLRAAAFVVSLGSQLLGQPSERERSTSLILFGDVNLGRMVGQELLKGDVEYPFRYVRDSLSQGDVVFVNLESQLSDQDGETQHPKYNLIFTGPPSGAMCLRLANVTVVSTANNHAFDYGMKALRETLLNLHAADVECTGTSFDSVAGALPVVVEKNGIRLGFLAYTEFVNLNGSWRGRIALYDSLQCRQDIEQLRHDADVIVVSYHGGVEYSDRPTAKVRRSMQQMVEAGADVVVGHHPHYVQGIEKYQGKLILYSLGNFVFYQPQRNLAGFGLGVKVHMSRRGGKTEIGHARLLAVRAGFQPSFTLTGEEEEAFFKRLQKLSSPDLVGSNGSWFVNFQNTHE